MDKPTVPVISIHPYGRMSSMTNPAPFLRWAGGKRKLLPILHAAIPPGFDLRFNRFFEPFVGGGAVMFSLSDVLQSPLSGRGRIVINDINVDLVETYTALRDYNSEVVEGLAALSSDVAEKDYYSMRGMSPESIVEKAIRLIYLNRTGFNGLYRVNSSGGFNVPWGKLKNPTVCNEPLLKAVGGWLQHVEIRSGSFISAVSDAEAGDLVYFDPPYIPLNTTSSFSKYAKDDFRITDQYALAEVIEGLSRRGVRVILSNSYTSESVKIFGPVLELRVVNVSRSIAAKSSSRGVVQEVIGLNYSIEDCSDPRSIGALPRG